jgi:hypothetical protein
LSRKAHEDITENGYIRSLYLKGPADAVGSLAESLRQSGSSAGLWLVPKEKERLFFSAALWDRVSFTGCALFVSYSDARLVPSVTYTNPFQEIRLNRKRSIFVERTRVSEEMEIPPDMRTVFERLVLKNEESGSLPVAGKIIDRIRAYESIVPELQDYS